MGRGFKGKGRGWSHSERVAYWFDGAGCTAHGRPRLSQGIGHRPRAVRVRHEQLSRDLAWQRPRVPCAIGRGVLRAASAATTLERAHATELEDLQPQPIAARPERGIAVTDDHAKEGAQPGRANNLHERVARADRQAGGQIAQQSGQSEDVVAVQMRDEDAPYLARRHVRLHHAVLRALAAVEQPGLAAEAHSQPLLVSRARRRAAARAEEGQLDRVQNPVFCTTCPVFLNRPGAFGRLLFHRCLAERPAGSAMLCAGAKQSTTHADEACDSC